MADFQRWERQRLPQGGLITPQAGSSLAESFGSIGQAVPDKAGQPREKEGEIDQPEAAEKIAQLQTAISKQLPDIQAQSADGLADYPNLIDTLITRATEQAGRG